MMEDDTNEDILDHDQGDCLTGTSYKSPQH